jgi:hypothetical protein
MEKELKGSIAVIKNKQQARPGTTLFKVRWSTYGQVKRVTGEKNLKISKQRN